MKKFFTSEPMKAVYFLVLVFAICAALIAGLAIPITTGNGFWAIPITAAVIVAFPSYAKAIKWCLGND